MSDLIQGCSSGVRVGFFFFFLFFFEGEKEVSSALLPFSLFETENIIFFELTFCSKKKDIQGELASVIDLQLERVVRKCMSEVGLGGLF